MARKLLTMLGLACLVGVVVRCGGLEAQQKKARKGRKRVSGEGGTERVTYKTVGDLELTLEIDLPKGDGPFPVIIYIHGGGWRGGNDKQFLQQSCHLTKRGIAGARINYRKVPQGGNFKDTMQDCMDAIDYIRQNAARYKIDMTRVGLAGGSAGGHLSAIAAQRTPECILYVGFNGGYDLADPGKSNWPNDKLKEQFLGGTSEEILKDASAVYQVKTTPPDTLLLHGTKDTTIDPIQCEHFAKVIREKGGRCEIKLYEGEKHAFFNPNKPKYEATRQALEDHAVRVFGIK